MMLDSIKSNYSSAYGEIQSLISSTGVKVGQEAQSAINALNNVKSAIDMVNAAQAAQSTVSSTSQANSINTSKITTSTSTTKAIENAIGGNTAANIAKQTAAANAPQSTATKPTASTTTNTSTANKGTTTATVQKATSIKLSHTALSIKAGKAARLTATASPATAVTKYTWTSSNTKVATVSGGTVTGVAKGSATIAVKDSNSGKSATCKVAVTASSGGDGKITNGERVKFASGKYTATSSGSGASGSQKLGDYVYVTKINSGSKRPYHIARDKAGKYPLGWVAKSQLSGYKRGTKGVSKDELAWTNEDWQIDGPEMIIRKSDGAILTPLKSGDSVMPANLTENLWKWGSVSPNQLFDNQTPTSVVNVQPKNYGTSVHYDSLITVYGAVDKYVIDDLQQLSKDLLKNKNFVSGVNHCVVGEMKKSVGKNAYR